MPKVEFSLKTFPQLQEFICPISKELVVEPVVAADGHLYNKFHFEEWLKESNNSPVTREVLESNEFFPSHTIARFRDAAIKQYGLLTENEFFEAVKQGRVDELKEKNYFDFYLNSSDEREKLAVSVAIEEKNLPMLTYLLAEDATVDAYETENEDKPDHADLPLARACRNGFEEGIALLLTKNLTHCVSKRTREKTVIMYAISGNVSVDTIKLLAAAFPGILLQGTKAGYSALHHAVYKTENIALIRYLLAEGLPINENDNENEETAFHWLCKRKDLASMSKEKLDQVFAMADVMIELGADPNAKNKNRKTPLDLAKGTCLPLYDHLAARCYREERFHALQTEHQSLKRKYDELKEVLNKQLADSQKTIEALELKLKQPRPAEIEPSNRSSVVSSLISIFSPSTPKELPSSPTSPPAPH